jgi:hypothetical protein
VLLTEELWKAQSKASVDEKSGGHGNNGGGSHGRGRGGGRSDVRSAS